MLARQRAEPARRRRDRDPQPLRERAQLVGRAAIAHALADQDHRPLRRASSMSTALRHALGIGAAARGDVGAPFARVGRLLGGGLLEDVERHVEHHRPRPAGHHGLPRLPHHQRHLLAARRLEHLLAHGAHGRREVRLVVAVQFLERAAVELAGRHVAGDRHERHGVEIRVGERDRQVRRARAAGGEGRDRLAFDAVVDVGHEARDRLVVRRDGLDVALALEQRVEQADVAVAAQAEDVRHLLAHEIVDDDLAAVEDVGGHVPRPPSLSSPRKRGPIRRLRIGRNTDGVKQQRPSDMGPRLRGDDRSEGNAFDASRQFVITRTGLPSMKPRMSSTTPAK